MSAEPELRAMLRELASMPQHDRSVILESLGQAERERLRMLLSDSEEVGPSPGLAKLIDDCRSDSRPPSLTERGSKALLAAADALTGQTLLEEMLERLVPKRSLMSRIFGRKASRA